MPGHDAQRPSLLGGFFRAFFVAAVCGSLTGAGCLGAAGVHTAGGDSAGASSSASSTSDPSPGAAGTTTGAISPTPDAPSEPGTDANAPTTTQSPNAADDGNSGPGAQTPNERVLAYSAFYWVRPYSLERSAATSTASESNALLLVISSNANFCIDLAAQSVVENSVEYDVLLAPATFPALLAQADIGLASRSASLDANGAHVCAAAQWSTPDTVLVSCDVPTGSNTLTVALSGASGLSLPSAIATVRAAPCASLSTWPSHSSWSWPTASALSCITASN